jgi:hypothetical protein
MPLAVFNLKQMPCILTSLLLANLLLSCCSCGWGYTVYLWTAANSGSVVHLPDGTWVWSHGGIMLTGKAEDLGERPVPVPVSPQIPHGLTRARTRTPRLEASDEPPEPWQAYSCHTYKSHLCCFGPPFPILSRPTQHSLVYTVLGQSLVFGSHYEMSVDYLTNLSIVMSLQYPINFIMLYYICFHTCNSTTEVF